LQALLLLSNYTQNTEIYTLSLHDALPILILVNKDEDFPKDVLKKMEETFFEVYPKEIKTYNKNSMKKVAMIIDPDYKGVAATARSEEHTSELQSRENLVCRLLLEKKKTTD